MEHGKMDEVHAEAHFADIGDDRVYENFYMLHAQKPAEKHEAYSVRKLSGKPHGQNFIYKKNEEKCRDCANSNLPDVSLWTFGFSYEVEENNAAHKNKELAGKKEKQEIVP